MAEPDITNHHNALTCPYCIPITDDLERALLHRLLKGVLQDGWRVVGLGDGRSVAEALGTDGVLGVECDPKRMVLLIAERPEHG